MARFEMFRSISPSINQPNAIQIQGPDVAKIFELCAIETEDAFRPAFTHLPLRDADRLATGHQVGYFQD